MVGCVGTLVMLKDSPASDHEDFGEVVSELGNSAEDFSTDLQKLARSVKKLEESTAQLSEHSADRYCALRQAAETLSQTCQTSQINNSQSIDDLQTVVIATDD